MMTKGTAIQAAEFEKNAREKLGGKELRPSFYHRFDTDGMVRSLYLELHIQSAGTGRSVMIEIAARELGLSKTAKSDRMEARPARAGGRPKGGRWRRRG
jgi:hypothetical protein